MLPTRHIVSLSAAFVLGASVASAQSKFEGVLTIQLSGNGPVTEAQYSVKGDRARMDASMGSMPIYMLFFDGKVVSVLPTQRMYMEQPIPNLTVSGGAADKKANFQWTGKKETIAGHECEHVTISDATGQSVDLCAAKDLGTFLMAGGPGGRSASAGWQAGLGANVFPLKVTNSSGTTVLEVTKIEKKAVDATLFELPDGFQKMDMPMMGRPPLR